MGIWIAYSGLGILLLILLIAMIAAFGGSLFFLFRPEVTPYFKSAAPGPGHGPGPGQYPQGPPPGNFGG
jgi:hypothetical protein